MLKIGFKKCVKKAMYFTFDKKTKHSKIKKNMFL